MRPRGEIREALFHKAAELPVLPLPDAGTEVRAGTWRDLAALACVGYEAARRTVDNMVTAGELIVVGHRRVPHACRPMNLVARPVAGLAGMAPQSTGDELARCWAEFR